MLCLQEQPLPPEPNRKENFENFILCLTEDNKVDLKNACQKNKALLKPCFQSKIMEDLNLNQVQQMYDHLYWYN